MTFQPIFIIGAGRSGTNILRNTLCAIEGWETWNCDEINLIWRHKNSTNPDDIFTPEHARPEVKKYLNTVFEKFATRSNAKIILEKTCANSLRIPFIETVFPNARYIYLIRDGRDVALSASKRWHAPIEANYLFKKLRFVPATDIPRYSIRFVKNRLWQFLRKDKRQSIWGPVFHNMQSWMKDRHISEICARQWSECIHASDRAFRKMPKEKVFRLKYEDLIEDPETILKSIIFWVDPNLKITPLKAAIKSICQNPTCSKMERNSFFTPKATSILQDKLKAHGYI